MLEATPLTFTRIVALPAALDAHADRLLRVAADEALLPVGTVIPSFDDEHAIIETDTGWFGVGLTTDAAQAVLERCASWQLPATGFVQGRAAGLPVKAVVEADHTLIFTPFVFRAEFVDRIVGLVAT